ncbi:NodB-like proteiny domain-containing protein [Mycena indigotica]|uniref:chitin deacetylase n=1 Tax=Mycena indigotica TaxID=2126181 RepID=A0A8H6SN06_9AGAR|nr:NodB-like proteiny domain-containing protein [Mycena indigotica]KAF7301227.1 NodB-like proteiny domain-containing protein [Mycena indigotica]
MLGISGTATTLLLLILGATVRADEPTTEEQMAANLGMSKFLVHFSRFACPESPSTGDKAECVAYGYQPVTDAFAKNEFPPIWVPVAGVSNDTEGYQKFLSINGSVPNIAPKGVNGVPTPNLAYDAAKDPDCWWTNTQCVTPKHDGVKADIADVPEPKTLGYGFDDGPYCGHNEFYNFLTSKGQKATMFYIGSNVVDGPLQAQRAVKDGHELCVHTWAHPSMTALTNEQVFGELWYTIKAIKLVTGVTPTCWRPPRGDADDRVRFIAQSLGLDTIMWKYDSFDWEQGTNGVTPADVQNNYNKLINDAKSGVLNSRGAILLTHELSNYTMQTAVDNYPKLVEAFDYIVPVGVAYNKTNPYAETSVTQPSFAQFAAAHGGPPAPSGSASSSPKSASGSPPAPSASGVKLDNSNSTKANNHSGAVTVRLQLPATILAFVGLAMTFAV